MYIIANKYHILSSNYLLYFLSYSFYFNVENIPKTKLDVFYYRLFLIFMNI